MRGSWRSSMRISDAAMIALWVLSAPLVWASNQDHTCQGGHNCNNGGGDGGQNQSQDQAQTQTQANEQTAQGGSAVLTQGDLDVIVNETNTSNVNTDYKRNAPTVHVPSISPTAPCIVTGGFGLSFPGGGGSLGGGKLDKGCEERETARMLAEMGAGDLALGILCSSNAVERTIGRDECDSWQPQLTVLLAHAPEAEEERQEEFVAQQQVQQQQQSQIDELQRRLEKAERRPAATAKPKPIL